MRHLVESTTQGKSSEHFGFPQWYVDVGGEKPKLVRREICHSNAIARNRLNDVQINRLEACECQNLLHRLALALPQNGTALGQPVPVITMACVGIDATRAEVTRRMVPLTAWLLGFVGVILI